MITTACGASPTGPNLSTSAGGGVAGTVVLQPCWPNPDTAWMVNLPVCR